DLRRPVVVVRLSENVRLSPDPCRLVRQGAGRALCVRCACAVRALCVRCAGLTFNRQSCQWGRRLARVPGIERGGTNLVSTERERLLYARHCRHLAPSRCGLWGSRTGDLSLLDGLPGWIANGGSIPELLAGVKGSVYRSM